MAAVAAMLDFPIRRIFDLQVTPILPIKFRVSWPFGLGEEAQNRFSVKERYFKIDFQNNSHSGHFGFRSEQFTMFDLQDALIDTSHQV